MKNYKISFIYIHDLPDGDWVVNEFPFKEEFDNLTYEMDDYIDNYIDGKLIFE